MVNILWKRGEIAPEERFLLLSTIFCYLMLDVKTRIRFSLRDKRLFEITEVEITKVDCKSWICPSELHELWCEIRTRIFTIFRKGATMPMAARLPLTVYLFSLTTVLLNGGGRVVRWSWVNFQCRGVLQIGL